MGLRPIWIIIPSRMLERSKTRLAAILDPAERRAFSRACLRHVVKVARHVAGARRTVVVSRAGEVLELARRLGVYALMEQRPGLNAAVRQAGGFAKRMGASGIIVLHADLPQLSAKDVACLMGAVVRHRGVALAPDRDLTGTNALGLRPPGRFRFRFGPGSFDKHCSEARRLRAHIRVVARPGLAADVDTPKDYLTLVIAPGAKRPECV